MRVTWLTDIHLSFNDYRHAVDFVRRVDQDGGEAVLIGGDIGEALDLPDWLALFERHVNRPVYFVLGNHDYYGSSLRQTRAEVARISRSSDRIVWLGGASVLRLSREVGLVGHGGWADGSLGDYAGSRLLLNDFLHIKDFIGLGSAQRLSRMQTLAGEAASQIDHWLPHALRQFRTVVVLTHVPPFREACRHENLPMSEDALPFFACGRLGTVIRKHAQRFTSRRIVVLSGHTHCRAQVEILPNLIVCVGGAEYGQPEIQDLPELF